MIASPYGLVVFIISHKNSVVVNVIYDYDFHDCKTFFNDQNLI